MKLKSLHIRVAFSILLYVSSIFSSSFFHNHESEHDHTHQLSSCENILSNSPFEKECKHDSHFSFEDEDCFWCDDFTTSIYDFKIKKNYFTHYVIDKNSFYKERESNFSLCELQNKGPPILLLS